MSTLLFPVRKKPAPPSLHTPPRTVRIGLLGAGGVGQAFLQLCRREKEFFLDRGLDLQPAAALVRDASRPRTGLPSEALLTSDPLRFLDHPCDVVVEVLGGVEPARTLVAHCLKAGVPVVSANKSLLAAHGKELKRLARQAQTTLRIEASALAGVPLIGNLRARPLAGRFHALQGILNGTSNYLLTCLAQGQPLEKALTRAQELGLAEPDPCNDLSGQDAAEKLALLLRELAGLDVDCGGLERQPLEDLSPLDFEAARRLGGVLRPLACAWLAQGDSSPQHQPASSHRLVQGFVAPAFLPFSHPLAGVEGIDNGLLLVRNEPSIGRPADLFYRGPGAGPEITAETLLDDVFETIREKDERKRPITSCGAEDGQIRMQAPRTSWFLRIGSQGRSEPLDDLLSFLADHGLFVRTSHARGDSLWLLTSKASRARVEIVSRALAETSGATVLPLRALEVPHGC